MKPSKPRLLSALNGFVIILLLSSLIYSSNATPTNAKYLQFAGTGGVTVTDPTPLRLNTLSVDFWFKVSTAPSSGDTYTFLRWAPYGFEASMNPSGTVTFSVYDKTLIVYPAQDTPQLLAASSATGLADGNWHHFAGTYDSSTLRLYVDGTLLSTATTGWIGVYYGTAAGLSWGTSYGATPNHLVGAITNARIWNYVLTAADIEYHRLKVYTSAVTNIVLNYGFLDALPTMTDSSGSSNAGTAGTGVTIGTGSIPSGLYVYSAPVFNTLTPVYIPASINNVMTFSLGASERFPVATDTWDLVLTSASCPASVPLVMTPPIGEVTKTVVGDYRLCYWRKEIDPSGTLVTLSVADYSTSITYIYATWTKAVTNNYNWHPEDPAFYTVSVTGYFKPSSSYTCTLTGAYGTFTRVNTASTASSLSCTGVWTKTAGSHVAGDKMELTIYDADYSRPVYATSRAYFQLLSRWTSATVASIGGYITPYDSTRRNVTLPGIYLIGTTYKCTLTSSDFVISSEIVATSATSILCSVWTFSTNQSYVAGSTLTLSVWDERYLSTVWTPVPSTSFISLPVWSAVTSPLIPSFHPFDPLYKTLTVTGKFVVAAAVKYHCRLNAASGYVLTSADVSATNTSAVICSSWTVTSGTYIANDVLTLNLVDVDRAVDISTVPQGLTITFTSMATWDSVIAPAVWAPDDIDKRTLNVSGTYFYNRVYTCRMIAAGGVVYLSTGSAQSATQVVCIQWSLQSGVYPSDGTFTLDRIVDTTNNVIVWTLGTGAATTTSAAQWNSYNTSIFERWSPYDSSVSSITIYGSFKVGNSYSCTVTGPIANGWTVSTTAAAATVVSQIVCSAWGTPPTAANYVAMSVATLTVTDETNSRLVYSTSPLQTVKLLPIWTAATSATAANSFHPTDPSFKTVTLTGQFVSGNSYRITMEDGGNFIVTSTVAAASATSIVYAGPWAFSSTSVYKADAALTVKLYDTSNLQYLVWTSTTASPFASMSDWTSAISTIPMPYMHGTTGLQIAGHFSTATTYICTLTGSSFSLTQTAPTVTQTGVFCNGTWALATGSTRDPNIPLTLSVYDSTRSRLVYTTVTTTYNVLSTWSAASVNGGTTFNPSEYPYHQLNVTGIFVTGGSVQYKCQMAKTGAWAAIYSSPGTVNSMTSLSCDKFSLLSGVHSPGTALIVTIWDITNNRMLIGPNSNVAITMRSTCFYVQRMPSAAAGYFGAGTAAADGYFYHSGNAGGCLSYIGSSTSPATTCQFCGTIGANGITGSCIDSTLACANTKLMLAAPLDTYEKMVVIGEARSNDYAYYYVLPPHDNLVLRVIARTVTGDGTRLDVDVTGGGDNIDLLVKRGNTRSVQGTLNVASSAVLTQAELPSVNQTTWDLRSLRRSNPLTLDVPQSAFDCTSANGCKPFLIAVQGLNQFPSRAGASQFQLSYYYDFAFPDFRCLAAAGATPDVRCRALRHNIPNSITAFSYPSSGNTLEYVTSTYTGTPSVMRLISSLSLNGQGAVYLTQKPLLSSGFETTFSFRISSQLPCGSEDGMCVGGDGFAFVIQNPSDPFDSSTPIWPSSGFNTHPLARGSQLGYGNISRSIAVEFDTWWNPEHFDPKQGTEKWFINATEYVSYGDNHIGIFSHGSLPNSADHSSAALLLATPSIPNLSDLQVHTARILYIPRVRYFPGSLSVFIDGLDRPVLVADVTMHGALADPRGATCAGHISFVDSLTVFSSYPGANNILDVAVSVSDTHLQVWPTTLRFTADDWWSPRTVVVSGVRDYVATADVTAATVTLQNLPSTAPGSATTTAAFGSVSSTIANIRSLDAETPRLLVLESAGSTVISYSSKSPDTVTISLTQPPAAGESVVVTPTDTSAFGFVFAPATLTFDRWSWNLPQILTISTTVAVGSATATVTSPIAFAIAVTGPSVYAAVASNAATVQTITASIVLPTALMIMETGGNTILRYSATAGQMVSDSIRFALADPTATPPATITLGGSSCFSASAVVSSGTYLEMTLTPTCTVAIAAPGYTSVTITPVASGFTFFPATFNVMIVDPSTAPSNTNPIAFETFGSTSVLEYSADRCVLDSDGAGYLGFTAASGKATQNVDIHSWKFCHRPGCVAY